MFVAAGGAGAGPTGKRPDDREGVAVSLLPAPAGVNHPHLFFQFRCTSPHGANSIATLTPAGWELGENRAGVLNYFLLQLD